MAKALCSYQTVISTRVIFFIILLRETVALYGLTRISILVCSWTENGQALAFIVGIQERNIGAYSTEEFYKERGCFRGRMVGATRGNLAMA